MTRADLEAAAAEKYPDVADREFVGDGSRARERAAYIQGRLDQAEADARIAEREAHWTLITAAIRKGVE